MSAVPDHPELPLVMAPQPLDEVVLHARVLLDRPEVEYAVTWRAVDGKRFMERCFLDSIWPLDRMSERLFRLLINAHNGNPWERRKVRATLDVLQSAYGCEEPF